MKKLKENKEIVIIVLVLILGAFYWFQLRPVQIKKECSWFTEITPADVGITKEQAEINKKAFTEQCNENAKLTPLSCFRLKKDTEARLPQSGKTEIREATKGEYDSCLRRNGLSK